MERERKMWAERKQPGASFGHFFFLPWLECSWQSNLSLIREENMKQNEGEVAASSAAHQLFLVHLTLNFV